MDATSRGRLMNDSDLDSSFRIGKYLTVIPNYLHIGMQPFEGRRVFEERLSVPATIRLQLENLPLPIDTLSSDVCEPRYRHNALSESSSSRSPDRTGKVTLSFICI
jgi:hypothetical protein